MKNTVVADQISSDNERIAVGLGDLMFSSNNGAVLVSYSLGSCVGVTVRDTLTCLCAMAHVVLPRSAGRLSGPPARYADSAIAEVIRQFALRGSRIAGLQVKLAGGARILALSKLPGMDIGAQNVLAVKQALRNWRLVPVGEDTGGSHGRTVELYVRDGSLRVVSIGRPVKHL